MASQHGDLRPVLVIGQAGGPTAVMNASLAGVVAAVRDAGRPVAVAGARFGFEGVEQGDDASLDALGADDLELLRRTPGAALGSSRHRPSDEVIAQMVRSFGVRGVRALLMIGGNDTAETLHRIHLAARRAGVPLAVVGIAKTIDNDLPGMDHCPGYGSAARYLALAVREAGIDTAAMRRTDPVKVIEVMGRNAGWLAAASALGRLRSGDAPQVIFFPERPRPVAQMLREVQAAYEQWGWAVVVISENQRDNRGEPLAGPAPVYTDPHGHPYFESPGMYLVRLLQQAGLRARYERPGSLQRTSVLTQSPTDAAEAYQLGEEAVRRALDGQSDIMVAVQRAAGPAYAIQLDTVPLEAVAHRERRLPDAFIAPSGTDVTVAFLTYAGPLVGGALPATHASL